MSWKHLHAFPPIVVRLMARRKVSGSHVRALSNAEIAIAAGLPLDRVVYISKLTSWDEVTVFEAERFALACHFDPMKSADRNRKHAYDRKCSKLPPHKRFQFLRKGPEFQSETLPLIQKLMSRALTRPHSEVSVAT